MNNLLRLLVIGGVAVCAILIVALGMARHDADLLAPFNMFLFAIAVLVYLLPTALAFYRDCQATAWIAAVNILLGWTLFGWFISIGWAAGGKIRTTAPAAIAPPSHPIPGH